MLLRLARCAGTFPPFRDDIYITLRRAIQEEPEGKAAGANPSIG